MMRRNDYSSSSARLNYALEHVDDNGLFNSADWQAEGMHYCEIEKRMNSAVSDSNGWLEDGAVEAEIKGFRKVFEASLNVVRYKITDKELMCTLVTTLQDSVVELHKVHPTDSNFCQCGKDACVCPLPDGYEVALIADLALPRELIVEIELPDYGMGYTFTVDGLVALAESSDADHVYTCFGEIPTYKLAVDELVKLCRSISGRQSIVDRVGKRVYG